MNLLTYFKIALVKLRSGTVFIFIVEKGQIRQASGEAQRNFLKDCEDSVQESALQKGLIYGVRNAEGKVSVKTSGEIPASVAQRFRNAWSFYS